MVQTISPSPKPDTPSRPGYDVRQRCFSAPFQACGMPAQHPRASCEDWSQTRPPEERTRALSAPGHHLRRTSGPRTQRPFASTVWPYNRLWSMPSPAPRGQKPKAAWQTCLPPQTVAPPAATRPSARTSRQSARTSGAAQVLHNGSALRIGHRNPLAVAFECFGVARAIQTPRFGQGMASPAAGHDDTLRRARGLQRACARYGCRRCERGSGEERHEQQPSFHQSMIANKERAW